MHMPELRSLQGFRDISVNCQHDNVNTVLLGPNYQLQQTHK